MKRFILAVAAVSFLVGASQALAQAKPSFAGKWTLVPDPNAAATGAGAGGRGGLSGLGTSPTIEMDATTLTLTRTNTQGAEIKSVYKLDGTDSKNTLAMGNNSIETTSKATWDANKLVIKTTIPIQTMTVESTMALSLDASGQLIVESTNMGRGGAAPTTTKATYKKN